MAFAAGFLACLALALSPSVARAQSALVALTGPTTNAPSPGGLRAAPVLEGRALVWAVAGPHETEVVQSEVPGQPPVTIGDLPSGQLALAASPRQLVVSRSVQFCPQADSCTPSYSYWRSASGETLTGFTDPQFGVVQVSGEWLGYTETGNFAVGDPFEPATPPLRLGFPTHPTLAYPYLASVIQPKDALASVIVTDLPTGAVVLQVPEGPGGGTLESDDLDTLQSDGTVVVDAAQPTQPARGSTGGLPGWASPAQPSVHPLPALSGAVGITIADGLVAGELRPPDEVGTKRLRVVNLAGTVVAERTVTSPLGALAFDGARLVWAQEPCTVAYASVWNIGETPPAPADARCALVGVSVPPPPMRLHGGRLHLTLRCPESATATGCPGRLWVRARAASGAGPGAQGLAILGHVSYRLAAGSRRRIAIDLDRRIRRFLAAGTVIVQAEAIASRPTGERPTQDPGVGSVRFSLKPRGRPMGTAH